MDEFFTVRNSSIITPKEGINYDLKYQNIMLSAQTCSEILMAIHQKMNNTVFPYNFVNMTGGFGQVDFAFAEHPLVNKVYHVCLESDKKINDMFEQNVKDYLFDNISMITVDSIKKLVETNILNGLNVYFFHPDWFINETFKFKPKSLVIDNYKKENIQYMEKKIEEWFGLLKNPLSVVFLLPKNYNFEITSEIRKNFDIVELKQSENKFKFNDLYIFISKRGQVEGMKNAEIISREISMNNWFYYNSENYKQKFFSYIIKLIKRSNPKSELLDNYIETIKTNEKIRSIWIRAFTHDSFSDKYDENYQVDETFGDRIIKTVFTNYIFDRLTRESKRMTSSILTNLERKYMSKDFQSLQGYKLKFIPFVRKMTKSINMSLSEDMFETFMSALYETGNIFMNCMGLPLCYNFISYIMSDIILFNNESDLLDSKSKLTQIITQLGLMQPNVKINKLEIGGYSFSLILNQDFLDKLNDMKEKGIIKNSLSNKKLSIGIGGTKTKAKNNAYDEAYHKFTEITGINFDNITEFATSNIMISEALKPLKSRLDELLDEYRNKISNGRENNTFRDSNGHKLNSIYDLYTSKSGAPPGTIGFYITVFEVIDKKSVPIDTVYGGNYINAHSNFYNRYSSYMEQKLEEIKQDIIIIPNIENIEKHNIELEERELIQKEEKTRQELKKQKEEKKKQKEEKKKQKEEKKKQKEEKKKQKEEKRKQKEARQKNN